MFRENERFIPFYIFKKIANFDRTLGKTSFINMCVDEKSHTTNGRNRY